MNARQLAGRDLALAALMGAIGSDFGADRSAFGSGGGGVGSMGSDGDTSDFGTDSYGWSDPHGSFGWNDPHGNFGQAAPAAPAPPNQAALMQAWNAHHASMSNAARRERLLYPNKGSHVKVEGYQFALSAVINAIGTAQSLTATDRPQVDIRPERVTMNAPQAGFVTFTQLQVGNINTLVGGTADAFSFNANAVGQGVSYPTLSPAVPAAFTGSYTGIIPPGFPLALVYTFVIEFKGPASMTA